MDRYIKMLLIKLSRQYKVTVTTVMFFYEETGRLKASHTLRISRKTQNPKPALLHEYRAYSKRDLVSEMTKWANQQSQ